MILFIVEVKKYMAASVRVRNLNMDNSGLNYWAGVLRGMLGILTQWLGVEFVGGCPECKSHLLPLSGFVLDAP